MTGNWLKIVGMTGFEPAASSSRTKRATGLRYIPKSTNKNTVFWLNIATLKASIMGPGRLEKMVDVLNRRQVNLTVVMENVRDPHNISAVMRTCDAVGIQDIYILTYKIPRFEKWGIKSSSSAAKWLTVHEYEDPAKCIADLRNKYDRIYTTHLAAGATSVYDIDFTKSVALVFGNEHAGVSEEVRAMADGNFIIPQMGIIQSLNISVACAVSIYEAFRQKDNAGHYSQSSIPPPQRAELLRKWGVYGDEANRL